MSRESETKNLVTWLFTARSVRVRYRQTDRQTDAPLTEGPNPVGVWTLKSQENPCSYVINLPDLKKPHSSYKHLYQRRGLNFANLKMVKITFYNFVYNSFMTSNSTIFYRFLKMLFYTVISMSEYDKMLLENVIFF